MLVIVVGQADDGVESAADRDSGSDLTAARVDVISVMVSDGTHGAEDVLAMLARTFEEVGFAEFRLATQRFRAICGDAWEPSAPRPPEWNGLYADHPRVQCGTPAIDAFATRGAGEVVLAWNDSGKRCWRARLDSTLDRVAIASVARDVYVVSERGEWALVLTIDQVAFNPIGPFFIEADPRD